MINEGIAGGGCARRGVRDTPNGSTTATRARQYARIRELEGVLARAVAPDLDRIGLGLRLRYLSGGLSDESRTIEQYVLPERSGYYLGSRMVERAVAQRGLAWTVRASAQEIVAIGNATAASA